MNVTPMFKRLPAWWMLVALGLMGASAPAHAQQRAKMGNLTLESSQRTHRQFNTNYGFVKQTTVTYRVLHKGQPVRFRDEDGRSTELSFWAAWTLPEAPRPAVLAANRATYLITEDSGEVRVQMLRGAYHDTATWQWLDAEGRVGERQPVYIQDKVQDRHELLGGNVLAVSARALLDVRTLQVQALDTEGDFESLKHSGGYAAAGDKGVLMYSAAAGQVALLARNQAANFAVGSTGNPEFAMLVVEQASNNRYAVPFDRDAVRLADPETEATPAWAAANFEWRTDGRGRQRLQARKRSQPVPWQGRIRDPQLDSKLSRDTTFILGPVLPRMVPALATLIEQEFAGKRLPTPPDDPSLGARLEVNGLHIDLRHFDADDGYRAELHMTASLPTFSTPARGKPALGRSAEQVRATNRLIMVLGEKINALLAQGALQQHFTTSPRPP